MIRIPELIMAGLFVLGTLLRLVHWPFGSILTILGLGSLAFYYIGAGFWTFGYKNKETGEKENILALSIFSGPVIGTTVMGILFKLMMWPGAYILLGTSILGSLILVIITVILAISKKKLKYTQRLMWRTMIMWAIAAFLFFVPPVSVFRFFHGSDPELIRRWETMNKNPGDEAARENYYDYRYRTNQ